MIHEVLHAKWMLIKADRPQHADSLSLLLNMIRKKVKFILSRV